MGKLSFKSNKFVFHPAALSDARMAEKAAFKLERETLRWVTRKIEKAVKLRAFADESAEIKFKKYFITDHKRPDMIPYPDHLDPKPFQIESAWHLITRSPAYCADQPGLGKSITATLAMNAVPGKTLIVCPPYLKYNWKIELHHWLTDKTAGVDIVEGSDWDFTTCVADIIVLPDSLLTSKKVMTALKSLFAPFRWLFVDEAHRFKDENAQRTKALIEVIAPLADRVALLSGTPMPNNPMELYPVLSALAPEAIQWRTKSEYGHAFCNAKKVTVYKGPHRQPEVKWDFTGMGKPFQLRQLRHELREKLMIRHLKKDVLKELPPKTRQIIFTDQPKKLVPLEKAVLKNHTIEELLGLSEDELFNLGDIAKYRRECGLALIEPATEIITDILESTKEPLVVFANHVDVVEGLAKNLKKFLPVVVRGGMTAKHKQHNVTAFQTNAAHRLIIGNIDSMGVGYTLTRAKRGLTVEPSWVPGVNEQAEDRIHRITQKENVFWQYLVQRDSLNERMLWKALDKQQGIDVVMS